MSVQFIITKTFSMLRNIKIAVVCVCVDSFMCCIMSHESTLCHSYHMRTVDHKMYSIGLKSFYP